jgi:cell division protease FtsH
MVTVYGMNHRIGNVSFNDNENEFGLGKPYSESTSQMIDEEVRQLISEAYERTKKLMADKRDKVEVLAQELLKTEILFQADLEKLIGKRPFETKTTVEEYMDDTTSQTEEQTALDQEPANVPILEPVIDAEPVADAPPKE